MSEGAVGWCDFIEKRMLKENVEVKGVGWRELDFSGDLSQTLVKKTRQ